VKVTQSSKPTFSPTVRHICEAVAEAWGLDDPAAVVLVPMTGRHAGEALLEAEATLADAGAHPGDIFCVEERSPNSETLQSVMLFDQVRNTTTISFNHPDRPYVTEEQQIQICKDSTLQELKQRIAASLDLSAKDLHLCRAHKSPQLKDESKTLRGAGLADSGSIFVGHGAPCEADEFNLKISVYTTQDKTGPKSREAFSHIVKAGSSVRSLRMAILEPLISWAASLEGSEQPAPFSTQGLKWQQLRLRDGQAGKQFSILRDERTLRSALLGFSDGRQVAVQVLDCEEELGTDDLIMLVRPWRVAEGRLHAATEIVVQRTQTLAEFRDQLTKRFHGLLGQAPVLATEMDAAKDGVGAVDAHETSRNAQDDWLEICCLPSTGPPTVNVSRCQNLKWADSRLNSTNTESSSKALSEYKEVRDGMTLIVRSALQGQGAAAAEIPAVPKVKGAGRGKPAAPKLKNQGTGKADIVTVGSALVRQEHGLHIDVFQPDSCPHAETAAENVVAQ